MQSETARRLAANREKYNKAQTGIDEDVDRKTGEAQTMTLDSNKELEKRLTDLVAKRDNRAVGRTLRTSPRPLRRRVRGGEGTMP